MKRFFHIFLTSSGCFPFTIILISIMVGFAISANPNDFLFNVWQIVKFAIMLSIIFLGLRFLLRRRLKK